ncbi:MAG: pilus assembly protein PilP [Comamonadaceae bacterium CG1_02_60_18]|nr:MAG: pilus assembly protein PilP [Comamonadaceae bacterium CG1_02_60_18]PIQ52868.1 MAG: pilus assembly protein PilP [Comamonadaceae bacterium CG12_big_fil_rev_8_21_14_0_65_59_15]
MTQLRRLFPWVVVVLTLVACSSSSDDELQQWMVQQKNQTFPKVKPLSEPKQFKPESYSQDKEFDPFNISKLTIALKRDSAQAASLSGALLAPELTRRKEPLEEFPLDTIAMVGSLTREGKPVALVTVGKLLYQVRPGEYLGQNYGRVTKIAETELTLREIVQDATGEWVERMTSLQLQERLK